MSLTKEMFIDEQTITQRDQIENLVTFNFAKTDNIWASY